MESVGFLFRRETRADIEALDITTVAGNVAAAHLLAWDATRREEGLAAAWEAEGVAVTYRDTPLTNAEASLVYQAVPAPVILELTRWLIERTDVAGAAAAFDEAGASTAEMTTRGGSLVTEEAVWMGPEEDLFGLVTWPPAGGDACDRAIILVNGGNNHRCGINRNYTEWARRWAVTGVPVLRLDIRGLGDSPPRRGLDLNLLYRSDTKGDLIQAIDWLQERHGISRVVLCGLCAGAFQAIHAARADPRVCGLALLELLRFYQNETQLRYRAGRWLRRSLQRAAAAVGVESAAPRSALARWLEHLCGRGTAVLVVYRPDAGMYQEFARELAPRRAAIAASGRFTLELTPDTNHIFSPLWSQEQLARLLDEFMAGDRGRAWSETPALLEMSSRCVRP